MKEPEYESMPLRILFLTTKSKIVPSRWKPEANQMVIIEDQGCNIEPYPAPDPEPTVSLKINQKPNKTYIASFKL